MKLVNHLKPQTYYKFWPFTRTLTPLTLPRVSHATIQSSLYVHSLKLHSNNNHCWSISLGLHLAMDVQTQSSTVISTADGEPAEIPLTVFDRYAPRYHVSVLFAFAPPMPPNSAIIEGLARTLVHFPTLTSRIGTSRANRPCLLVGGKGGGALVVEAAVAGKLADWMPLQPGPELERLCPPWKDTEEPTVLQVQLNRFDCGGLILGVTADHRVADGQSMSTFYIAWSQSVRGVPITSLPVYDRSFLKPRSPPRCDYEHWGSEFKPINPTQPYAFPPSYTTTDVSNITNILLHFSSEFIATELTSQVKEKYTIFEILLAHLWRKITMARNLDGESTTIAKLSVNGRRRLKPKVPDEFFGNLVLTACAHATVKEVAAEGGLAGAARRIHEAIRERGDGYFRSVIDFGEINGGEELVRVDDDVEMNVMGADVEADSLLGFRFQEVDFGGGGRPLGFYIGWVPLDGLVVFMPSTEKDGGVDVFVGLLKEHAEVLKKIAHSLD